MISLKTHKEAIHEGAQYMCSMFDYPETDKGNQQNNLKNHKRGVMKL